jgi:hypothetical protein
MHPASAEHVEEGNDDPVKKRQPGITSDISAQSLTQATGLENP